MDFIKAKMFTSFIIALLVIMNVITIYLLWEGRGENRIQLLPKNEMEDARRIHELLKRELDFNEAQIKEYLDSRRELKDKLFPIEEKIRKSKIEMFSLAFDKNASNQISDSLLAIVLRNQEEKERITFSHLTFLKSLCNDEQIKKLNKVMFKLFGPEHPNGHPPPPRE